MKFLDRKEELQRLNRLASSPDGGCAFLWGRRRIGKTRLLLEWCNGHQGLYVVADQSAASVQRRYLAGAVEQVFEGFSAVEYPDWTSFLSALARVAKSNSWTGPFVIDELPYIVLSDKTFPSVLQRWLDHEAKDAGIVSAFAGSAQHMMHGLALDDSSPLYGRAKETMALGPLPANYIGEIAGAGNPLSKVRSYAVWGGIPRYWELAKPFGEDLDSAVDELMLNPMGPLHMEPDRLLAMEVPSALQLRSLLDVIGAGAHRVSEIGGRLGQPATSLSRALSRLCKLGFVKREKPFGVHERGSKRTLYRLNDPFLRTWFKTVAPRRAFLASATKQGRLSLWHQASKQIFAETFENLSRACIPRLADFHSGLGATGPFGPSGRYWEPGGKEWDIVSLSQDGTKILLGEVKWSSCDNPNKVVKKATVDLLRKGMPNNKEWANREPVFAVFVPQTPKFKTDIHVVNAAQVLKAHS